MGLRVRAHGARAGPPAAPAGSRRERRAYAAALVQARTSAEEQRTAQLRLLDHYLHTAAEGDRLLRPRDSIRLDPPQPGVTPEPLTDRDHALAWFAAEHHVLLSLLAREPDEHDRHTWQLAWASLTPMDTRGYWRENLVAQEAGLAAARRLGDQAGQGHMHRNLGRAYRQLGRLDEAYTHSRAALDHFEGVGDRVAMTHTYVHLSALAEKRGDLTEALSHAERAYDSYQALGHRSGLAYAANAVGWFHGRLGHHRRGLPYCQEALTIFTELDNPDGVASTWDSLGALHFGLGEPGQAAEPARAALNRT